uniref:LAM_G_DOMAIN domain-containing protein n=1 Tax=Wuchereria bancrofti TaxID=6293 RepID=A0A1I8EVM9_WUCBA
YLNIVIREKEHKLKKSEDGEKTKSLNNSESDIDLLVPVKSLLNERVELYKAKGLDGFPAVGIKRGVEIVVPYRQYLPRKFFRNFAFTAVIRPDDRQGGYLFAVVNPLDTVVDLGVLVESAGDNQTNITLLYTDSSKETDTKALASFLVPEFTKDWVKFALEIQEDNVVLYFRCIRFATRQVKRKPVQLVMDDAHKLYIASAGPILRKEFEMNKNELAEVVFKKKRVEKKTVETKYFLWDSNFDI